ncbi:MAG: rhodanese-like domain-containing protein, partial [Pyrinomonadaceae bacterium]
MEEKVSRTMHKEITVEQLNRLLDGGSECQVIDVREFSEFNSERIDGARLIPLSEFESQSENIDGSK